MYRNNFTQNGRLQILEKTFKNYLAGNLNPFEHGYAGFATRVCRVWKPEIINNNCQQSKPIIVGLLDL